MKSNARKYLLFLVLGFGLLVGAALWRNRNTVQVNVTSYHKDVAIQLAEATDFDEEPLWFSIEAGKVRLSKKAYFFKLEGPKLEKTGLIAVNDATPIVLK